MLYIYQIINFSNINIIEEWKEKEMNNQERKKRNLPRILVINQIIKKPHFLEFLQDNVQILYFLLVLLDQSQSKKEK